MINNFNVRLVLLKTKKNIAIKVSFEESNKVAHFELKKPHNYAT